MMLWLGGGLHNPLRTAASRIVTIGGQQQWRLGSSLLSRQPWICGIQQQTAVNPASQVVFPSLQSLLGVRTFALNKRDEYKRKVTLRKLKLQGAPKPKPKPAVSEQMKTWAEFQRNIAVQGFDTGQVTEAKGIQRNRGGKAARKRKIREQSRRENTVAKRRIVIAGGGKYPATRLSDAETAILLAKAYAGIPARTGKRGTNNLRRQKRRWFLVRKIHAKIKRFRISAHFRRMGHRSRNVKAVMEVKRIAPEVQLRDRSYQEEILQRWASTMTQGVNEEAVEDIPEGELVRA